MIGNLTPYPAYRDSGMPWMGEVPAHWTIKPLKHWIKINAKELSETTPSDYEFRYLDIGSVGTGVLTGRMKKLVFGNAPSRARRVLRHGDTVISTVRTYLKAVYFVEEAIDLVASTGFAVLTPQPGTEPRFVSFLVQSDPFTNRVTANSVGTAYPAIAETKLATFHVAIPPLPEQAAIARFLNYVDRRIRHYIRAKRKLIALLEEQKQAIIHRAVTRGLDPDVQLKPPGVEYLSKIPKHWETVPLKYLSSVQSGIALGKNYSSHEVVEYPYLRVANVQDGQLDLSEVKSMSVPREEAERSTLQQGDVLMTEGGDPDKLGRASVWEDQITPCLHQNHIFAVRTSQDRLEPYFLAALLTSQYAKTYFLRSAKQTTNLASTNKTTIGQFPVLLPSSEEQAELLAYLQTRTNHLHQCIANIYCQIDLIREYRTRLIFDVVTGKLDVREAAAHLPEEAAEPEEVDDLEEMGEDENVVEEDQEEET